MTVNVLGHTGINSLFLMQKKTDIKGKKWGGAKTVGKTFGFSAINDKGQI